mgnify:FL=1
MANAYEFRETSWGLTKQSFLLTRQERERYNKIVRRYKKEFGSAHNLMQQMAAEHCITLHIMIQRLIDRRLTLFDATDYEVIQPHTPDIDSEDIRKKETEFNKYFAMLNREMREWMKLLLADKVEIVSDVSQFFANLTNDEQHRMMSYRGNGEKQETNSNR